ncbi:MAG: oligopeptide transporter, OPT family [Thermoplasmata archaeon M11B2D]|nr:MAG: oligopeptide transporter, OPT family [Thermoplasmata archaeon M11B2D]PNX53084.1 MAG: oligopeptide transporter, OPT family [Thermoplasmata archaeon M9B2D]
MDRENFPSFIPAEKTIPELTIKAVLVGTFLAIVLGAANAYLGLYAGMTVSAIIPGAVMALALMKPFKPTILEVNIATMGASAGECIAAGVIFTIPALILLGAWTEIHYLETTFIALIGGMLGVFWMVPLRRALVVKTDLPFPEGIAVAAVLTTTVGGEQTQQKDHVSGIWLAVGALTAALFKFGQLALNLFRDTIDGIVSIGKYAIFGEEREAWFYAGTTTSPALLAVGWIIGPRISSYVLVGGLLGWVIIAPLLILVSGLPEATTEYSGLGPLIGGFYKVWSEQVRYIGVGAMLIGGLWAVYSIRTNLVDSVKEAVLGFKKQGTKTEKRTEQDLNYKLVFLAIGAMTIPIFVLYQILSGLIGVSLLMAILTIFLAFIASALAGYLTGLVGSSNCPISGVTVTILLIVSLLMLGLGVTGTQGMAVVIFISAVVCIGGSISGDLLQTMASGQMIGATPKKLQISMIFGVLAISATVGIVIGVLHQAFTIGSTKLPAPQAFLMKGIVQGVLGGNMLWPYVVAGAVLALVLILINLPVLPVAIGIYLPFTLSVPIFIGGGIRALTDTVLEKKYGSAEQEELSDWELAIKQTDVTPKENAIRTGLLFTAGLVAGEALMGVVIAVLIVLGIHLAFFDTAPWWPGLLVFAFIGALLAYIPIREILSEKKTNK